MNSKWFKIALLLLAVALLGELGVMRQSRSLQWNKERQAIKTVNDKATEAKDTWCAANSETIKEALHGTVIKIADDYALTTVTISYDNWKALNEVQRRGLREAVRCHSKNRYGGQFEFVDINGVVIGH